MKALEDRPPYVKFKKVAVEDRAATITSGHYVAKDVDFAVVTPAGSKDELEYVVEEWFERLEESSRAGRFPPAWLSHYRSAYEMWKKGEEIPLTGIPLAAWPAISPAQYETLKAARLYTVEDVAQMNEESIARVGMGARALKQRAEAFLQTAKETGKAAEELAALRQQNKDLEETVKRLSEQVDAMRSALPPAVAKKTVEREITL